MLTVHKESITGGNYNDDYAMKLIKLKNVRLRQINLDQDILDQVHLDQYIDPQVAHK